MAVATLSGGLITDVVRAAGSEGDGRAGSSAANTIGPDSIAAGAYRVYPRFARQDNDVLLVTASHPDVEFAVIGPAAHPSTLEEPS